MHCPPFNPSHTLLCRRCFGKFSQRLRGPLSPVLATFPRYFYRDATKFTDKIQKSLVEIVLGAHQRTKFEVLLQKPRVFVSNDLTQYIPWSGATNPWVTRPRVTRIGPPKKDKEDEDYEASRGKASADDYDFSKTTSSDTDDYEEEYDRMARNCLGFAPRIFGLRGGSVCCWRPPRKALWKAPQRLTRRVPVFLLLCVFRRGRKRRRRSTMRRLRRSARSRSRLRRVAHQMTRSPAHDARPTRLQSHPACAAVSCRL